MDYITYSIIIDDIVFPTGQTAMGVLGGGGPQTAFGMKLWTDKIGLLGGIGHDFPADAQEWLEETGLDLSAIRTFAQYQSLRAWQVFEYDGRRTQVWRTQGQAIPEQLALQIDHFPASYKKARAFHFGIHPDNPNLAVIHALRDAGIVVSVEPFRDAGRELTSKHVQMLVSAGHIFSPNLIEAESMFGTADPHEQIKRMVAAGAQIIALRMGEAGSIVHRADSGETWQIPAAETAVVDPTGAGNAYCGGFVVGWCETGDLQAAGIYGSVAASFMIEQIGLPPAAKSYKEEARKRFDAVQFTSAQLSSY